MREIELLQASQLLPVDCSEKLSNMMYKAACSATPDNIHPSISYQSARWHREIDRQSRKHSLDNIGMLSDVRIDRCTYGV
jgi:hypothetical protein